MVYPDPVAQAKGRIGGLTKSALAVDRDALTRAARDAAWQKWLGKIPAEITDPAERQRRAEMLRRADMHRLALRSATVRKQRAQLRRQEAELSALEGALNASGLDDCGR